MPMFSILGDDWEKVYVLEGTEVPASIVIIYKTGRCEFLFCIRRQDDGVGIIKGFETERYLTLRSGSSIPTINDKFGWVPIRYPGYYSEFVNVAEYRCWWHAWYSGTAEEEIIDILEQLWKVYNENKQNK